MGGPRPNARSPPLPAGPPNPPLTRPGSPNLSGGGRLAGGLLLKRLLGSTILTLINAPSSCASCMCAIALSAPSGDAYTTYASPLFVMNCLFIGISRPVMSPYEPKISRRWPWLTFLVSFSITTLELRGAEEAEGLRERERERESLRVR